MKSQESTVLEEKHSPERDIAPHLSLFESYINYKDVESLSLDETKKMLGLMHGAALGDAALDAERKGHAVSPEISVAIERLIHEYESLIGDNSKENVALVNSLWLKLLPLLENNFELPATLQKTATLFIISEEPAIAYDQPGGHTIPGVTFKRGRELEFTRIVHKDDDLWAQIVNPTDITQSPWIRIGQSIERVSVAPPIKTGPLGDDFWHTLGAYVVGHGHEIGRHKESNVLNRTYAGRLVDHERLLHAILDSRDGVPAREALYRILYPDGHENTLFIDIGPGINNDTNPAQSTDELAQVFPQFDVRILDLPDEVDKFKERAADNPKSPQAALQAVSNIHLVGGNGLAPLSAHLGSELEKGSRTVIVRIANSLEVYTNWDSPNGDYPSLKEAIYQMGKDLHNNPAMILLNRAIVVKQKNDTQWYVVGRVSSRGFNAIDQRVTTRGRFDFDLDLGTLESLLAIRAQHR